MWGVPTGGWDGTQNPWPAGFLPDHAGWWGQLVLSLPTSRLLTGQKCSLAISWMNSVSLLQVSPVTLGPPGPKCPEGRCLVRSNLGPQSAAQHFAVPTGNPVIFELGLCGWFPPASQMVGRPEPPWACACPRHPWPPLSRALAELSTHHPGLCIIPSPLWPLTPAFLIAVSILPCPLPVYLASLFASRA